MSDIPHYTERLEEWAEWFVFNHDRLRLYYQGLDTRARRFTFCRTMVDGDYELLALALTLIRDAWLLWHEADMAHELGERIQAEVAWFYRHKDTITDPDKQFVFLVQAQGKVLQLLKAVGEELARLNRGAVHERAEHLVAAADNEQ